MIALILANMSADKAYAVSLLIAGRNLEVGRPAAPQNSREDTDSDLN